MCRFLFNVQKVFTGEERDRSVVIETQKTRITETKRNITDTKGYMVTVCTDKTARMIITEFIFVV
jgi:hypothetical protein